MSSSTSLAATITARLKPNQTVGIGTGTTVQQCLPQIAKRIQTESLAVSFVTSSHQTTLACQELGIPLLDPASIVRLDWAFDGADQFDDAARLIKGRGGAMLREKIIAATAEHFVVIVGEEKHSRQLGSACPVPIEVVPIAVHEVTNRVTQLGATECSQRLCPALGRESPYYTEHGNFVIDANFSKIHDDLERDLNAIPGVIENGIFTRWANELLIIRPSGVESLYPLREEQ